jgi:hypothetical protein
MKENLEKKGEIPPKRHYREIVLEFNHQVHYKK